MYILILLNTLSSICQVSQIKMHPFSGTFVVSIDAGFTKSKTDYKDSRLGGRLTIGTEYYLPTSNNHIIGAKLFLGGQQIYSEDRNKTVDLPDAGRTLLPNLINAEMYISGLGLIYSYSIKDKTFPYVSIGLSNIYFSPKIKNGQRAPRNALNKYERNALVYDIDLGIRYEVAENFILKLEGGFHFPNTDNLDDVTTGKNKDFYATGVIGISYSFFGRKDSDGDGISDSEDMCPDTPPGIEVDEYGCPVDSDRDGVPDYLDKCPDTELRVAVDESGCAIDSDGDGIPDYLDKCPKTPAGIEVDENGCPFDSDGDGVADYLDKCPDTPAGVVVNEIGCMDSDGDGIFDNEDKCPDIPGPESNYGCPDEDVVEEEQKSTIAPREIIIEGEATFSPDKADIRPEAYAELDRIVKILKLYPDINWRIEGHSDVYHETSLLVRPISLRRAEAVLNYFVSKGIPSFQFKIFDMGDRFPIANNNTEYGRAKNRRVVLVREN